MEKIYIDNKSKIQLEEKSSTEETKLALYRRSIKYTQALLAAKSGIPLRTIQQYESRARDINKANVHTIWLLAKALQCRPDQIIDIEIDAITKCIIKREDGSVFETFGEVVKRKIHPSEVAFDFHQGWNFNWKEIQDAGFQIIELYTTIDNKLQGRISYIEKDNFYYVDHVENAPHNIGHKGNYIGVAANLFALVCKKSYDAGFGGCISFISKKDKKVMQNYIDKLHAKQIGSSQLMIIDENDAKWLMNEYGLEG